MKLFFLLSKQEREIHKAILGEPSSFQLTLQKLQKDIQKAYASELEKYSQVQYPEFSDLWYKSKMATQTMEFQGEPKKYPIFSMRQLAFAGSFIIFVLALGLFFRNPFRPSLSLPESSYSLSGLSANVLQLHGEGYLLNEDSSIRNSLGLAPKIHAGDRFIVEKDGFLDLEIEETAAIRVFGPSEVIYESKRDLGWGEGYLLYLKNGRIGAKLPKLKKNISFGIRTDYGNAMARGTRFVVSLEGEDTLQVAVLEGKVSFVRGDIGNRNLATQEIDILPKMALHYSGNSIVQTSISSNLIKSLVELEFINSKLQDSLSFIKTEEDLFRIYSILERVELDNGEKIIGVVYGMDESYLYIRTTQKERKIPLKKILNVEKMR